MPGTSCIDITNIIGNLREQLPTLQVHGVLARSLKCHVLSASLDGRSVVVKWLARPEPPWGWYFEREQKLLSAFAAAGEGRGKAFGERLQDEVQAPHQQQRADEHEHGEAAADRGLFWIETQDAVDEALQLFGERWAGGFAWRGNGRGGAGNHERDNRAARGDFEFSRAVS